jgi:hypothetical protein
MHNPQCTRFVAVLGLLVPPPGLLVPLVLDITFAHGPSIGCVQGDALAPEGADAGDPVSAQEAPTAGRTSLGLHIVCICS